MGNRYHLQYDVLHDRSAVQTYIHTHIYVSLSFALVLTTLESTSDTGACCFLGMNLCDGTQKLSACGLPEALRGKSQAPIQCLPEVSGAPAGRLSQATSLRPDSNSPIRMVKAKGLTQHPA